MLNKDTCKEEIRSKILDIAEEIQELRMSLLTEIEAGYRDRERSEWKEFVTLNKELSSITKHLMELNRDIKEKRF